MSEERTLEILVVEDSPTDARLLEDSLAQGTISKRVHVVTDGVQALDYIHRRPPFDDAIRPDVILLDLDLPRMNGFEVLKKLHADAETRTIPVIVMTASAIAEDILQAARMTADHYISKPPDLDGFLEAARTVEQFWLDRAMVPRASTGG